ncbi:MAG: glycosyltransferase family 2 protein [Bdellovibrionaceae bacterium]|nr:glycosyltransferase family 2 protein [Pseudobdellovibrionaceae bacterium]
MKITTVIPVFRDTQYLLDAIQSSFLQTDVEHEVIVVSDGNSEEIEKEILTFTKIPGVRAEVLSVNVGLAEARNAGFRKATGDFVRFLDADDVLLPDSAKQLKAFLTHSEVDVVIGKYLFSDRELVQTWGSDLPPLATDVTGADILFGWETSISIPIHSALFRRTTLQKLNADGPFRSGMRAKEDFIFWAELLNIGKSLTIEDTVCLYRQHGTNMCKDIRSMGESYLRAVNIISSTVVADSDVRLRFLDHSLNHFYHFYFRPQRGYLEEKFATWGSRIEHALRKNQLLFRTAKSLRKALT